MKVPMDPHFMLCIYSCHMSEEMFPEPKKFKPERFLEGEKHQGWIVYRDAIARKMVLNGVEQMGPHCCLNL
jgi:cytochrome P450